MSEEQEYKIGTTIRIDEQYLPVVKHYLELSLKAQLAFDMAVDKQLDAHMKFWGFFESVYPGIEDWDCKYDAKNNIIILLRLK